MIFPELESDESVILQAHNIKVKSVMFEAVLTNKRLILVDGKKGLIPPQNILIATIKTVEGGENAIRDPILTFSIFIQGGLARQMILTFPREASGERRRERDDWLKALNMQIEASHDSPEIPDTTAFDQIPSQTSASAPPSYPEGFGASTQKKKIEITRPRRNVIETIPTMPQPIETTTLPIGSFCSRCGNRVPPESVFCNKCGTPVSGSTGQTIVTPEIITPPPVPAPPVVPQIQIPISPIYGLGGEHKQRPLEEVIHSIEPLIEDSKPRTMGAAPLVPRHYPAPSPVVETPVVTPAGEPTTDTLTTEPPVQSLSGEPVPAGGQPSIPTPAEPPTAARVPPKKPKFVAIAALVIVILIVIGGIAIFSNSWGATQQEPVITPAITPTSTIATPTPTPLPTTVETPVTIMTTSPPPEVIIPQNGVWLKITYPRKYSGTYGTPGNQIPIGEKNTGDQFYMVSTIYGPVEASIQKMDGSSDMLVIEVYKEGELIKRETTIAPKGVIDLQVDLKPVSIPEPSRTVNPTVTPAETAATNSSVNATETA